MNSVAQQTTPGEGNFDDDGWTHVSKSKKSARPRKVDAFFSNPVDATRTPQSIQTEFQLKLKAWQTSSCRALYLKTLDQRAPDDGWPIAKAVCLASGSFSRSNFESRQRSLFQFAAFMDTVAHVRQSSSSSIHVFAQDPAYTPTDEQFLVSLGVEILHHGFDGEDSLGPAEQHLGPNTMVAELCIDCGRSKARAFCRSRAPLFAFSTFTSFVNGDKALGGMERRTANGRQMYTENRFHDDPEDAQLAAIFLKQYSQYRLPDFEPSLNTFRSFKALIKLPEEDED